MRALLILIFLFITIPCFSQQVDSFINASEAKRILSVLASDSLKGRANFSKEQEKAALFIVNEFRRGGLKPFKEYQGYIQPFLLLDRSEPLERVVVNDEYIPAKKYLYISPFHFPPSLELKDFRQVSFSSAISFQAVLDTLTALSSIDIPLLLLLPDGRADILKAFYEPTAFLPFQNNTRLIIQRPDRLEQLSVYFKPELKKKMLFNVLGYLPGRSKPGELVLITAHYDHVGYLKNHVKDSVFNGANDNASGTTSMMMLANYFAARNDNERSLLFVAFAGEEIGLYGSKHLVSDLNTDSIIAMVNLEMLGKRGNNDKRSCIVTGTGPLADFVRRKAKKSGIHIGYDNNPTQNLFARSDNYPFARKGVPAHTFMIWINNDPDYHQLSDEIETLDLENMVEIVKGLLKGIEELASGNFTPRR
jgi:hypothetical protein